VDLLPNRLFSRLVQQGRARPDVFTQQVRDLFRQMSRGGWFGADEIAWFNGRLFDDDLALDLDAGTLDILNRVSGLDWSSIEPSILGTLFERSLDPSTRAQLGAQSTTPDDIPLLVVPVRV